MEQLEFSGGFLCARSRPFIMNPIVVGPFGGTAGSKWDDGSYTGIRKVIVYSGTVIDAIQVEYDDNGRSQRCQSHGLVQDRNKNEITLDYPDEYLTSISGYYSSFSDNFVIFYLAIESNKRKLGPFGTKKGAPFLVPSNIGKIVGFFGSYGPYIVSIGAYVEPNEPFKTIGPFGGVGGVSWDDGRYTTVRSFTVVSESMINSIVIEYDKNGSSVFSSKHGGGDGGITDTVELDYPDEYVTTISGYYRTNYSPVVVQSLTIHTNKRAYGPFGVEKGKYFSCPPTGGKVIGFHGKCGAFLDAIGVHLAPTSDFYRVKTVGPFGGENASPWDDKTHAGIKQIRLVYNAFVSSICTEYHEDEGSSVSTPKRGGDIEPKHDLIKLDWPDEFLTSITGYYAVDDLNDKVIKSLTFHSNRKTYGPFGMRGQGKYFSFPSFSGKIVGLHGRSVDGYYIYSIGAHIVPIPNPIPSELVGPFGCQVGDPWDDGLYTSVRQLVITCGSIVNSICIEYDKNGRSVWSSKHGKSVGDKSYKIKIDYPYEFLTSLSGYCSTTDTDSSTIQSLTIRSNKKTYGPFGAWRGDKEFSSLPTNIGKIIGFHGTSGDHVHSIGVYLKPFTAPYEYKFVESFGRQSGRLWDDGTHTTVRQLVIGAGWLVDSIRIEYDDHGCSVWSPRHGGSNGGIKYMVKLDYPAEFLVSVSGYYDPGNRHIMSLTFQSNRRKYGPFGTTEGKQFSVPPSGGRIIGFHGRTSHYLGAIGVYMESPKVVRPGD